MVEIVRATTRFALQAAVFYSMSALVAMAPWRERTEQEGHRADLRFANVSSIIGLVFCLCQTSVLWRLAGDWWVTNDPREFGSIVLTLVNAFPMLFACAIAGHALIKPRPGRPDAPLTVLETDVWPPAPGSPTL